MNMTNMGYSKLSIVLLLLALVLPACATKVDKNVFHNVVLKEGEILPSKNQLKQERAKIVVMDTEKRTTLAKGSQLGEDFSLAIEKELNEAGSEVVDRNVSIALSKELRLAELNGVGSYSGPQVAQYAIRGQINSVDYTVTKSAQLLSKLFKNKNDIAVHFDHKAKMAGTIKIYELPSLRLLSTINVTGSATENDIEEGENPATGAALLKAAASYAISDKGHEFKNFFAPRGYIIDRRANATQSVFKVLIGRDHGVKPGDNIVIYSPRKQKPDAITGKEAMEELEIAQGSVSDRVGESESWVTVDDKLLADKVRTGDYVKVKYEENSFFTKIIR